MFVLVVKLVGGLAVAEETIFSGESKNIEYKVSVPDKSENI